MKKWILGLTLLSTVSAMACDIDGKTGFAPENDLYISADQKSTNGVTEEVFNQVIDEIAAVYRPVIEGKGKRLTVNRKWSDGTVNASAQQSGSNWILNMYGGLARHELVTKDGFAIVMCHELGHHLGGAPKIKRFWMPSWASNEGQSDYFATLKCFRRVYGQDDNIEIVNNMNIDEKVATNCDAVWTTETESALCKRSAMAAKSTADLLSSLRGTGVTDFSNPDTSVVSKTNDAHPAAQCRLDTYFAGSLCLRDMNTDVSDKDANVGTCNRRDNHENGLRSLCWFKPKN